jgi:hypothetical protein
MFNLSVLFINNSNPDDIDNLSVNGVIVNIGSGSNLYLTVLDVPIKECCTVCATPTKECCAVSFICLTENFGITMKHQ